jgi:acetyl esterase/lipase
MNTTSKLATMIAGIALTTQSAVAAPNPSTDPRIDPQVRAFLTELNKDSSPFWQLPQPKPQEILTALQNKTPVDMSGVTTAERIIDQDGRTVKLYIMTPEHVAGNPGVLFFIHGGVWIVGNFQNHQRLLRDLVVGTGQVGVFVEYTPLPAARYPTQIEESYAALKWVAAHAGEYGADGSRIAVAGNSVGGDMTAALTLMAKDRNGPKIAYQVLFIPATDASVDTESYREFGTGRFLTRAFMQYASTPPTRRHATTRTSRRCGRATKNSRACRLPLLSPPRTIRCATRARRTRANSWTQALRLRRFATTA